MDGIVYDIILATRKATLSAISPSATGQNFTDWHQSTCANFGVIFLKDIY